MTYQQFINKYVGTKQDFDRNNDVQCVDYPRLYVEEVWGMTSSRFNDIGGAVDAYIDYPTSLINGRSDLVELIKNRPDNTPQQGDIVVFNTNMGGGYGHIAIVNSATLDKVYVTEQNKYGNNDAIMGGEYEYTNVLGWLRKKPENQSVSQPQETVQIPVQTTMQEFVAKYKGQYPGLDQPFVLGRQIHGCGAVAEMIMIDYVLPRDELLMKYKSDYSILQDKYEAIKADKKTAEDGLIVAANNVQLVQQAHIKDLQVQSDNLTECQEQNKELRVQLAQAPTSTSKKWYQSKKFLSFIFGGLIPSALVGINPEWSAMLLPAYSSFLTYLVAQGVVDLSQNIIKK